MEKLVDIPTDLKKLMEIVSTIRNCYYKIVMTTGAFDLLNIGHIGYLNSAKRRDHLLLVGIDTDKLVKKIKGPKRPIQNEQERAFSVLSQDSVNFVYIADNWSEVIRDVRPDVFVTSPSTCDMSERHDLEALQYSGAEIIIQSPAHPIHTTDTIEKIIALNC